MAMVNPKSSFQTQSHLLSFARKTFNFTPLVLQEYPDSSLWSPHFAQIFIVTQFGLLNKIGCDFKIKTTFIYLKMVWSKKNSLIYRGAWRVSNPQHSPPQGDALPLSYRHHIEWSGENFTINYLNFNTASVSPSIISPGSVNPKLAYNFRAPSLWGS